MFTHSCVLSDFAEFGNVTTGGAKCSSHRTSTLLVVMKRLTESQEYKDLFEKTRRLLHPVDVVDKSMIDREGVFPFRKKHSQTSQAA